MHEGSGSMRVQVAIVSDEKRSGGERYSIDSIRSRVSCEILCAVCCTVQDPRNRLARVISLTEENVHHTDVSFSTSYY